MEDRKYESGSMRRPRSGPGRGMGRMGGGEKPKDLVGIWKKLLGYCKKYSIIFLVAILCATVGTVCTLMGPDKLSEMTNVITDGIKPDTEKFQEIVGLITSNQTGEDLEVDGVTITRADQQEMMQLLAGTDQESMLAAFDELPDSIHQIVAPAMDLDQITKIGLFLVALYVISYVLSVTQGWIMSTITQKVSKKMRSDISRKINKIPLS